MWTAAATAVSVLRGTLVMGYRQIEILIHLSLKPQCSLIQNRLKIHNNIIKDILIFIR